MGEVTISTEEYKNLVAASIRISIFADYVNSTKYSIGRGECGSLLGFEVKEIKED